jgi:hypothetical protein
VKSMRLALVVALMGAASVSAQGIANLSIVGNEVSASVDLPGVSADLSLSFEEATGLAPSSVGLSAALVDPHDPSLLSRLPAGGLVTVPGAFPVVVRVSPPTNSGLAFNGVATFGLHVANLEYVPNTPLRLFSAPNGGSFQDITSDMGSGSYRVRGTKGSFSEFLVVADARPTASVIESKFGALSDLLNSAANQIPGALLSSLQQQVASAHAQAQSGDRAGAAQTMAAFAANVQSNSGTAIPNVWLAGGPGVNVAGLLRADASTLSFSLSLPSGSP